MIVRHSGRNKAREKKTGGRGFCWCDFSYMRKGEICRYCGYATMGKRRSKKPQFSYIFD